MARGKRTASTLPRATVPHLKMVFGGTLGSGAGVEIWACSLKLVYFPDGLTSGTVSTPDDSNLAQGTVVTDFVSGDAGHARLLDAATTICKPAVTTMFTNLGAPYASLTYIKLNGVDVTDHQQNVNTVDLQFSPVAGLENVGGTLPYSSALVAEHRTNSRSRGFASHGRMSLPSTYTIDPATGKITTIGSAQNSGGPAGASALYGRFITAMSKIGTAGGTTAAGFFLPAIVYGIEVGAVYKTPGLVRHAAASPINSVFVSDIPGEIRSRQNKLKQGSSRVPVAAAA